MILAEGKEKDDFLFLRVKLAVYLIGRDRAFIFKEIQMKQMSQGTP